MRHLSLLRSLVISGLIALGACGGDNSSGTGSTGGAPGGNKGGTGGTHGGAGGHVGATGGARGTGAGGISGCTNIPACLQFLLNCAPSGTCMSQTTITLSPPSGTFSKCFSNGVKEATTGSLSGTTAPTSGTTTVSLNGTFCYAYDIALGAGGTSGSSPSLTFKNASGGVLATVVSANATTTTFSCGGQTYQVASSCTAAVAALQTGTSCTAGTCP